VPESTAGVISVRIVAGVVGTAVAAAAIAGAALLPLPTLSSSPEALVVTPVATSSQLVCPGAILQLGDSSGQNASVASAIGEPVLSLGATVGDSPTSSLPQAGGESAGAPTLLTAADPTASLAGAQYESVDEGDYRGLAAAACAQPSSDSWLVGGSTAVGRTTLLSLSNPGSVDATVALEVASEDGPLQAPGLTGILVPAGGQRVLSLAGFGPGLESLAVHVTSRGGPVAAALHQSIVRGIEASGVDIVGTTAAPATSVVIPGLVIADVDALTSRLGEEGFDDLKTVVRLYAPGDAAAQTTVRIVPEGEATTGASFELVLDAGVVTDVPIEGLLDGSYAVVIESSAPIVAAVRASTVAAEKVGSVPEGASDLAWFSAATVLSDDVFATVAAGPAASLHLVNPTTAAVTATVGGSSVTVAAGASVTVEVDPGASVAITGGAGLYASVSLAASGRLASYLVSAAAGSEAPVTVYLG
jgi:hypothetical protein